MKNKLCIVIVLIILTVGCTDEVEPQEIKPFNCSQFDNSFYCSDGMSYINETIDARCINYIGRVCYNKQFIIEDNPHNQTPHEVYNGNITISDILNLPSSYWNSFHLSNTTDEK